MADNGRDEEAWPHWRRSRSRERAERSERPERHASPSLDMPIASTSTGWRLTHFRSRTESPKPRATVRPARSRSAPRRPPSPVHPRSIRFLTPDDFNPLGRGFLKRKVKILDESKTEDDSQKPANVPEELIIQEPTPKSSHYVLPEDTRAARESKRQATSTQYYLSADKEPTETSTDDKLADKQDELPTRKSKLKILVSRRKGRAQARRSIDKGPATKVNRIMYTTDEEVRDALVEFGVFIVFLILTSLGKLLRAIDSIYVQSIAAQIKVEHVQIKKISIKPSTWFHIDNMYMQSIVY